MMEFNYMIDRIENDIEMDEILVSTNTGLVTANDIQRSIDEYLSKLPDPESIYKNKPMLFNGLLEYIYTKNLQKLFSANRYNDYELIDNIFDRIYINLCYMFSYVPMVTVFCNHLIHLDISNIYTIKHGIRLDNDSNREYNIKLNSLVSKWLTVCDSDLFSHIAHTGSVGGMFVAKVKGYSDQPQTMANISIALTPRIDEKQLMQIATAAVPELPDNMP